MTKLAVTELKVGKTYRLHARPPGDKRFSAVGSGGSLVTNLIYAIMLDVNTDEDATGLTAKVDSMRSNNPGWDFELRLWE
jgi:hypothetical protein